MQKTSMFIIESTIKTEINVTLLENIKELVMIVAI